MDELELCLLATYDFWDDPLHIKKVQSFAICGMILQVYPTKNTQPSRGEFFPGAWETLTKAVYITNIH